MTANEGLVAQFVREAERIATAARLNPGYDLAGKADQWVLAVQKHADALPADQGEALVARITGRLKIQTGSTLDEASAHLMGIRLFLEKLGANSRGRA